MKKPTVRRALTVATRSVSGDVFQGNSRHGIVTGGGITAGAGVGGSGSVAVTTTSVTPLNSVPCH